MTTLHERLQEAVNERLRIAEATRKRVGHSDPARIIRECQRDLRVLERHAPILTKPEPTLVPPMCSYDWADGDGWPTKWPCDEIKDLAEAYQIDLEDVS